MLCGIRYPFGINYHVKICQRNLEKIGESKIVDKCRPLWQSTARGFCQYFFSTKKWKLFPISIFWHGLPILGSLYNFCRFSIYFLISQISTFQTFPFLMYPNIPSFRTNVHSFYFDKVHLISTFITFHLLPSPFDLLIGAYSAPLHFQVV